MNLYEKRIPLRRIIVGGLVKHAFAVNVERYKADRAQDLTLFKHELGMDFKGAPSP